VVQVVVAAVAEAAVAEIEISMLAVIMVAMSRRWKGLFHILTSLPKIYE
jgi:hypothetical protein